MSLSLYDCTVACFLQTVAASEALVAKCLAHFEGEGRDLDELAQARLAPDMYPLAVQVALVAFHSAGAVEAVKAGELVPPPSLPQLAPGELVPCLADARHRLEALTPKEVNALEGQPMKFRARGMERRFTAEGFLLSFSLPNLHFHAAAAYDILRMQGAPLGKLDYIGKLRLVE